MEFLTKRNRQIYDQLTRVAGGDARIVNTVLSDPNRKSVSIKDAVREIINLRNSLHSQAASSAANVRAPQP